MPRLLLFNPDNDLALANGGRRYTAPPLAAQLRHDGARLPLVYAEPGDALFGEGDPARLTPTPWGWSAAVRGEFSRAGVPDRLLPDDDEIRLLRDLSHRRTAARLVELTEIGRPMIETDNLLQIKSLLARGEPLLLKSPWSSSGRGLIDSSIVGPEEVLRQASGVIRRQGSIMVEPLYERRLDFALLYDMTARGPEARGLSVFSINSHKAYTGNLVAPEAYLRGIIAGEVADISRLESKVAEGLDRLLTGSYVGPVGVDLIATPHGAAICEVNLRMTMGRVAAEYFRRRPADDSLRYLGVASTPGFQPLEGTEILSSGPTFTIHVSPKNSDSMQI